MIYFIQSELKGGAIKIGTSQDVDFRLYQHRKNFPDLVVLGVHDGDRAVEQSLHERFAAHRRPGKNSEWFDAAPELVSYISERTKEYKPKQKRLKKTVTVYQDDLPLMHFLRGRVTKDGEIEDMIALAVRKAFPDEIVAYEAWMKRMDEAFDADMRRNGELKQASGE